MKSDLPERTFKFAEQIVKLCRALEKTPGASRTLATQLLRSGTSVGANVEEAQASQSDADFIHKYSIACKEARETHYWLRLIASNGLVKQEDTNTILSECNELIAILTSIIKKMRARQK